MGFYTDLGVQPVVNGQTRPDQNPRPFDEFTGIQHNGSSGSMNTIPHVASSTMRGAGRVAAGGNRRPASQDTQQV